MGEYVHLLTSLPMLYYINKRYNKILLEQYGYVAFINQLINYAIINVRANYF